MHILCNPSLLFKFVPEDVVPVDNGFTQECSQMVAGRQPELLPHLQQEGNLDHCLLVLTLAHRFLYQLAVTRNIVM